METEEGKFWTIPHETKPEMIIICARYRPVLESMLSGIELAGVEDGFDFDDIAIYVEDAGELTMHYEMPITRVTLGLWFMFEAEYYHKEGATYAS